MANVGEIVHGKVSVGNIVVVTLMLETHVIFSLIVLATDSFIIVHLLNTSNSVAILAKNISSVIVVLSTFHFDVRSLSSLLIVYIILLLSFGSIPDQSGMTILKYEYASYVCALCEFLLYDL